MATNTVRFAVIPGVFKRQSKRAGRGGFFYFYWSFFDDVPIRESFGMAGRLTAHTNMLPNSSRKTSGSWVSRGPWVFGRAFGTFPASRPSRNSWAPPSLGPPAMSDVSSTQVTTVLPFSVCCKRRCCRVAPVSQQHLIKANKDGTGSSSTQDQRYPCTCEKSRDKYAKMTLEP